MLVGSGFALLVTAIILSCLPANAATERYGEPLPPYRYTEHAARVSTGRSITLYVDSDFSPDERMHIIAAMRQWNYVLNGFLEFRARLLPPDVADSTVSQIRRTGGFVVARVDSRHPIAHQGEGRHALAMTVSNNRSGFVYVISDRIGGRDLTGIVMHEFGHVLGAGHDGGGLMAPVYNAVASRCIDRDAVAMVANAQHLPLQQLNWCVSPGGFDQRPPMTSQR